MCGDIQCPSCGRAQGNWKCPICGAWQDDGCGHFDEDGNVVEKHQQDVVDSMIQQREEEDDLAAWYLDHDGE
jgi:hypothetical protein